MRKDHPDAQYCSVLLKYAKSFACQHSNIATYLSVDDKAIVPVGEPDCPIAASSRSHNRSLVLTNASIKALDHDFIYMVLYHQLPLQSIYQSLYMIVSTQEEPLSH